MKCKKVRRYVAPQYPTREYLVEHPELLNWVPKRWRKNRLVLAVLSMVVPLLLARQATAGDKTAPKAATVRVAPLFIHGDGRGAFGCVAVNPPVFLSEDEARQVVQDEAKKAGITFEADALTLKDVTVPVTDQFGFLDEEEKGKNEKTQKNTAASKTQRRDLWLDGYAGKQKIAYEIVSQQDFADWERKDRSGWCSVSSYDFKSTAETLRNGLAQAKGDTVAAVFYEPGASAPEVASPKGKATEAEWKAHWQAREKAGKELGEKELRLQVRDFIEWLKAQGVI